MMAAWREAEKSQASEDEEGEDEDDDGCWEYDSTWEDEEEEEEEEEVVVEEEQNDGATGRLEEAQERTEPDAVAPAAENTEKAANRETPQPPPRQQQPNAKWAQGNQEQRKSNFSFGFARFKSATGRNWMAARDMQRYRRHYPGLEETDTEAREEEMWNLSFYKNEIRFLPRGLYIDELLDVWQDDYKTLEENHSYIQWLFPLREQGMNWRAKLLTCREIQAFRKSKSVMDRFIQVYQLMLGFYGISLTNKETGELRRAGNWRERFQNLNLYNHNNLRITRILKCLGELGYEHYQVHLVKFFLMETLVHQTLPRVQKSALDYFMFTVRNKQKRRELVHFAWQHFDRKRDFVWGPRRRLLKFKPCSPEFLSNQKFEEEPEASKEGAEEAREAEGKNQTKPPNETRIVEHAAERTALPANDPLPDRETTSTVESDKLQAAGAAESQLTEKSQESSPTSAAREGAKGCSDTGGAPVSSVELERGGLAGESESSRGVADGDSLKESKKRKLEMNKLGQEGVALAKSPTDIERISCNLEGVVIDKEGPNCRPEAEETHEPLAPEGGGSKGAELVDGKVKRRKVDEMASKDSAAESTGEADAEVTSFQGQVTNCVGPDIKRTNQVHQEEVQVIDTSGEALTVGGSRTVGVHLSVGAGNPTEPEAPSGVLVMDKVDEQGTTSTAEGEGLQPCERLPASKEEEEGGTGQVEGGENATGEGERPTQTPDVKELHPKQY